MTEPSDRRPARHPWEALAPQVAALAFFCELAMLVTVVLAGWRLAPSALAGVALAMVLVVVVVAIWGTWLAPRSRQRLPKSRRLVAQCGIFVVTAVLAVASGLVVWGIVFLLVSVAAFLLHARWEERRPSVSEQ
ncbi:MAG: YrdB family protein [Jatrophihabitans sp.]